MPFRSYGEVIAAQESGKTFLTVFRKVPAVATAAGIWFDLSMVPGIPGPNYYASAPLVADVLAPTVGSGTVGIQYGGPTPSGMTKHLIRSLVTTTIAPVVFILCDYLLYYPFCDMGDTTEQTMDNTKSLPRYSDGQGVQIIAVEVAPQLGGKSFQVRYTNQDGIPNRLTKNVICNSQTVNGTLINTSPTASVSGFGGPFLPLQTGDTGVRSIEGFLMNTADTGLITLVLVKPICTFSNKEISTPAEVEWDEDRLLYPEIKNGAFLGLLCLSQSSLSAVAIQGELEYVWN